MEITIEKKSSYGNTHLYPVGKTGSLISELLGKKTVSKNDLRILEQLGYTFCLQIDAKM